MWIVGNRPFNSFYDTSVPLVGGIEMVLKQFCYKVADHQRSRHFNRFRTMSDSTGYLKIYAKFFGVYIGFRIFAALMLIK